jgi:AraC-like DNA-binding protein
MAMHWTTECLPPHERFPYWREAVCQAFAALTPSVPDDIQGFVARISARSAGPLTITEVDTAGHRVDRSPQDIAHATTDTFYLYRHIGGTTMYRIQTGVDAVLQPGDIVLGHSDEPFWLLSRERFRLSVAQIPVSYVRPSPGQSDRLMRGVRLPAASPHAGLISSFFIALEARLEALDADAGAASADVLARLITMGAATPETPVTPAGQEAVQVARVATARQIIARRFGDPALTPATLAAELGISLRSLHLAFEKTGETVAEVILKERLAAAHLALGDPAQAFRGVAEIAARCGFASLASFYRNIHRAFGAAPGDLRPRR